MINYLEDPVILSPQIDAAMKEIESCHRHFSYGGSLLLNAVGLIHRPVKDLDIIIEESRGIGELEDFAMRDASGDIYETVTDINGNEINRVRGKIGDIELCIFKLPVVTYTQYKLYGRMIRIGNVTDTLLAKRAYAEKQFKNQNKHIHDIQSTETVIDRLFGTERHVVNNYNEY